jgi:uncharacterized protein YndB with AHSA1/START domain
MENHGSPTTHEDHDLVLTRLIDVPKEKLFKVWTDAALLKQWFAPAPWTIAEANIDVRAGGASQFVMRSPEGVDYPNQGVYLEIMPNRRIVFTDAYTAAWQPSEKPFMTVIVTFDDEDGQTRYTATARHWTKADRDAHEKMGFHEGWGQCAEQMATLAATL